MKNIYLNGLFYRKESWETFVESTIIQELLTKGLQIKIVISKSKIDIETGKE